MNKRGNRSLECSFREECRGKSSARNKSCGKEYNFRKRVCITRHDLREQANKK
jgi:hypothetical protein